MVQVSYKNRAHATSKETEESLQAVLVETCSWRCCFALTLIDSRDKRFGGPWADSDYSCWSHPAVIYRPEWLVI